MNAGELITAAREEASDLAKPYLWSDAEWLRFATDAENEACRRARLLVDSRTPEIVQLAVEAGNRYMTLDDRVIFVRRAKLQTRAQPLGKTSIADLDQHRPGWEDDVGEPQGFIQDTDSGQIQLYPTPIAADTLHLTVVRLPLEELKDTKDCPEINQRWHRSLVYWMLYRAYMKQDVETKDEQKAADNLALFEQEFGPRSSALDENWILRQYGYDHHEGLF